MGKSLSIIAITLSIYNINGYDSIQQNKLNTKSSTRYLLMRDQNADEIQSRYDESTLQGIEMAPVGAFGPLRRITLLPECQTANFVSELERFDYVIRSKTAQYFDSLLQDALFQFITFYQQIQQQLIQMSKTTNHGAMTTFRQSSFSIELQEAYKALRFHPTMTKMIQRILKYESTNVDFQALKYELLNGIVFQVASKENYDENKESVQMISMLEQISKRIVEFYRFRSMFSQNRAHIKAFTLRFLYQGVYLKAETLRLVPSKEKMAQLEDKDMDEIIKFNEKYDGGRFMVFDEEFLFYKIDVDNTADFQSMIDEMRDFEGSNPGIMDYKYPPFAFQLLEGLLRDPKLIYNHGSDQNSLRIIKYLQEILLRFYKGRAHYLKSAESAKEMGRYLKQKGLFDDVVFATENPQSMTTDEMILFANWYMPPNQ